MDKIVVNFECPNCHERKAVKKSPAMKSGVIKCTSCNTSLKLTFDTTVTPQTVIAKILQPEDIPAKKENAQQPQKKATQYGPVPPPIPGSQSPFSPSPAEKENLNQKKRTEYKQYGDANNQGKQHTVILDNQNQPRLNSRIFLNRLSSNGKKIIEKYEIFQGAWTIGREDPGISSDIMFRDDMEMSRRSVAISVVPAHDGRPVIKLKVLNALNPIYVGSHLLTTNEEWAVQFDDIILLGKTKLFFSDK